MRNGWHILQLGIKELISKFHRRDPAETAYHERIVGEAEAPTCFGSFSGFRRKSQRPRLRTRASAGPSRKRAD